MRLVTFALSIIMLGIPGNLEAAKTIRKPTVPVGAVHKVRRGETAAKVARTYGLSLARLAELNPGVNLARLSIGRLLRVKGSAEPKALRAGSTLPRGGVTRPGAEPTPVQAVDPVPALPEIPARTVAGLVHLERLVPTRPEAAPLVGGGQEIPPTGAQEPVLVPSSEADPDGAFPVEAELGFEPADRENLDLLWPVETRTVSSAWGPRMRTKVVYVKRGKRNRRVRLRYRGSHKGVDLTAPTGADVYAALDGRVVTAKRHAAYGNYVVVDHGNGIQTLYAHNSKLYTQVGDLVRRGQKIAEVGRTGRATGPHLHFELKVDGAQQNPLPFLNDSEEIPAELTALNDTLTEPSR